MTIFDVLSMVGGLAMFLLGMSLMGDALEKRAGALEKEIVLLVWAIAAAAAAVAAVLLVCM